MTRKEIPFFTVVCLLFFFISGAFSQERTMSIGGKIGWPSLSVTHNVTQGQGRYGYDSLMLETNARNVTKNTDLLLAFDDSLAQDLSGHYTVVSGDLRSTSYAKLGTGAALCTGDDGGIRLKGNSKSLFGKEGNAGSFSIEFWLYPSVAENGETIFSWRSSRNVKSSSLYQRINASFFGSHLEWRFSNIFSGYDTMESEIVLTSDSAIIPDRWAHHCIAFDEDSGLLEYRIDGELEAIQYITTNKKENGSVLSAIFGVPSDIEICPKYAGAIDDFRIVRESLVPEYHYDLYAAEGGRFETQPLLMSYSGAKLVSLSSVTLEPTETGISFFVRGGNNFYEWTETYPEWIPVVPGELIENVSGIYFQVASELYPNGSCTKTPSVAELTLKYLECTPPLPPYKISATAGNGFIDVVWNESADNLTDGYMVFYGERTGEYISQVATQGSSPIDVGNVTKFRLSGLKNGKIYYIAVAAYSDTQTEMRLTGDLSKEVNARPMVASKQESK